MSDHAAAAPQGPSAGGTGEDDWASRLLTMYADAAVPAGLSEMRFPWKTSMWLNWTEGTVKVRHGYGAEVRTIFSGDTPE